MVTAILFTKNTAGDNRLGHDHLKLSRETSEADDLASTRNSKCQFLPYRGRSWYASLIVRKDNNVVVLYKYDLTRPTSYVFLDLLVFVGLSVCFRKGLLFFVSRMMLLQTEHHHSMNGSSSNGTTSRLRTGTQNVQQQHHPRLMDSPTLARVERAMLRHEEGTNREGQDVIRAGYTQSLLSTNNYGKESTHAIKRGLLWQQRDKLFSRWKERYFILTRDYLHCFRRASGADRISEMGQFLFKVKLVDVDRVEWENKKTYSTVALVIGRDGKIYLRAADGLEDWFELLEECMLTSKERRRALRHSHDGKPRDNNNITASLDEWLAARQKFPMGRVLAEGVSTPKQEVTLRRREWSPREEDWEHPTLDNRLSRFPMTASGNKRGKKRLFGSKNYILTDIDINSYDDSTLGAPSVTSYRMSRDVLCVQPPSLRASGSFRSTRDNSQPPKRVTNVPDGQCQYIKFRERSYSDIQRLERKPWRTLAMADNK